MTFFNVFLRNEHSFKYFCKKNLLNYFAHIFLSGREGQLQTGNFIGDFVKGHPGNRYPSKISEGILLHRKIDEFTDAHPVVRETVAIVRPVFGRYSAIVVDMYFDHFLAANFNRYSHQSIHLFAFRFYLVVLFNYRHLPSKVKTFIFHFVLTHRLNKYASIAGLKNSLEIMQKHKIPAFDPELIIGYLNENSNEIEKNFHRFFPDLIAFVDNLNSDSYQAGMHHPV